jgi:hypothetical protein
MQSYSHSFVNMQPYHQFYGYPYLELTLVISASHNNAKSLAVDDF